MALTRRQVELDPFDEDAHRRLMTRLAAGGDGAGALKAYRALGDRLQRELRVAPSRATQLLAEQVRAGAPASGAAAVVAEASSQLPFVGRNEELAQLEAVWRRAVAGAGAVAAIRGEAGIGKTRLAAELRERAAQDGALTAACAALDLGGAAPLSLWAELIRALLPALPAPPDDAVWPGDLAILAPGVPAHFTRETSPIAPDLQRTRLFEAVVALLAWAAQNAPLLLVLEDVHTADGPSLELAAYAARRLGELRAMVVVTRRELPHSPHADRLEHALRARGALACELELAPLTIGEGAALARAAAPVSDRDAQRIVERADGNPLLVVEAARALGSGTGAVTPTLRGSVRATLGELDRDSRRIVETAAVAARPVPVGPSAAEAATAALQTGLLIAIGDTVGFRHALLREAVYGEIAEPRRRGLHHELGKVAGRRRDPAAGGVGTALQARRRRRSCRPAALAGRGRRARRRGARGRGCLPGGSALDRARPRRRVARARRARGVARPPRAGRGGLRPCVGAAVGTRSARAGTRSPPPCARVPRADLHPESRAGEFAARARAARRVSAGGVRSRSAESAESADEERSEAVAALAWAEAVAGDIDEAERLLIELSHLAPADEALRRYDAGHARALALMRRGRFVESYGPSIAAGEAIAGAGRPDLAYGCWANAASAAAAAGEHDRALEFLDRGIDAVAGHGLHSIELHLLSQRSFVLRGLGRLEEARRAAGAEQAIAERLGQPELRAMASNDLGLVSLEAGEWSVAASLLGDSLEVSDAPISRPLTRLALAEALARGGDPDGAAEQVRETVLEPIRPSDFPETLVPRLARVQALIALVRGDREEATRRIDEAIGGWQRLFERTIRADSITSVLADLGRPVVGLVEPERELERARSDLEAINALVS